MSVVGHPIPVTFGEELRCWRSPHLVLTETRHAHGMRLHRHAHAHACVNFVLAGVYDEGIPGVGREHGALGLVYKPAEAEHENRFERGGARCLLVELLDDTFAPEGVDLRAPRESRDARAAVLGLALWHELGAARDPLALESLATELWARFPGDAARRIGRPSARLEAALELLHDDPGAPWTLTRVAAEVGLHPSHLARAFHARHGTSLGEYLRQLRVAEAARRLAGTDEPIAGLADALGFADQSHLTRLFQRRMGLSPAAWRRSARRGGTRAETRADEGS